MNYSQFMNELREVKSNQNAINIDEVNSPIVLGMLGHMSAINENIVSWSDSFNDKYDELNAQVNGLDNQTITPSMSM